MKQRSKIKNIVLALVCLIMAFTFTACNSKNLENGTYSGSLKQLNLLTNITLSLKNGTFSMTVVENTIPVGEFKGTTQTFKGKYTLQDGKIEFTTSNKEFPIMGSGTYKESEKSLKSISVSYMGYDITLKKQ